MLFLWFSLTPDSLRERELCYFSVRMLLLDRLVENHWLFNILLWDSNRAKLFISSPHPGHILLLMLAVCLLVIIVLGFGFYLWFFITSSEHSHVRLLNILNVYLSVGCIGLSILGFTVMLTSGLGYQDQDNTLGYLQHTLVGFHIVAIALTFLFISIATFINQFQPKVYLDISVAWRHFVAIPTMLFVCIITQTCIILWVKHCCISSDHECIKITGRTVFLIPVTCFSLVLQSLVIIDDICGFQNIIKFVIPMNETPVINFENPTHGLHHHVVSKISLTRKFISFTSLSPNTKSEVPESQS